MKHTHKGGLLARAIAVAGAVALGLTGVAIAAGPASATTPTPSVGNLPSGPYTLNITKFEQPNPPSTAGHDGTQQSTTGLTPIAGVDYSVALVNGVDLTTPAGWNLTQKLSVNTAGQVTDGTNTYSTGTPTVLGPTDGNGATSFTTSNVGVYLVTETSAPSNVTNLAAPFLVTLPFPNNNNWLTSVYVYPKNTVANAPTKVVDDSSAYGLGDTVNWTIKSTVPNLAQNVTLSNFTVSDALDARLTPPAASAVTVTLAGNAVPAGDYTTTISGQNLSVNFNQAGLTLLTANQGAEVDVKIPTVVNAVGNGTIQNTPVVNINNNTYTGTPVQTTWGALTLKKVDASSSAKVLSGAQFQVFTSSSDAKSLSNPVSVSGQSTFTSDSNGIVSIAGLKSQNDGTGNNLVYYIVETQAPAGYQINSSYAQSNGGQSVTVYPGTTANQQITVTDPQVLPFMLPLTGSTGTLLFVGGGIALIAVALGAAFLVFRRRNRVVASA